MESYADAGNRFAAKFALERALWKAKREAKQPAPVPPNPAMAEKIKRLAARSTKRVQTEPEMTAAEAEADLAERKRKFFEHWPV
jgi:hypothetical protein